MSVENEVDYAVYLSKCHLNQDSGESLRGYMDGTISNYDGMPNNPTPEEIIIYREKPCYSKRKRQLAINKLGLEGGRPYVEARLSRFAGETKIDWVGGCRPDGSESTGRLQQTHAFPYLARIAGKINQYVFSTEPQREGANVDVLKDITRDGRAINDLMREVSDLDFSCAWCWIGVDAPARKPDGTQYTQAEKEAQKIRPYWQVYHALDVLDWKFDEQGELIWLKSQRWEYEDSNPATLPKAQRVITLWERGKATEFRITERKDGRYRGGSKVQIDTEEFPLTDNLGRLMTKVPFVMIGNASARPIAFDDLESINRTIMDLGSVDRANIFNSVYAQLVLPASLMTRMQSESYTNAAEELGKLVLGYKYPILMEEGDPEPKYLMPDASSLEVIPKRVQELKSDLFEVVGLALEQQSRQVASAEAKAWDFLDVAAVMTARAELLEDAERKAVNLSVAWDDTFEAWEPKYNRDFDVGDFQAEIAAIVMAGNMSVPDSVSKMLTRKLVQRADRIGSQLTPEELEVILDDIESWTPGSMNLLATPEPQSGEEAI